MMNPQVFDGLAMPITKMRNGDRRAEEGRETDHLQC